MHITRGDSSGVLANLGQAATILAAQELRLRDSTAALATTMRHAVRVLAAVALCPPGTLEVSPVECALSRQHLADVVAGLAAWHEPVTAASPSSPDDIGLLPDDVARLLHQSHRADAPSYRALLRGLLHSLDEEAARTITRRDLALLEEIAVALAP